jgi:hypothetical protein
MRRLILTLAAIVVTSAPALAQEVVELPPLEIPLASEDLGEIRGQGLAVEVLSDQQLSATSSGNSVIANTVRSGDITFSGSALSGFSGVGNFVVNTGNNNNLQGAISVNIVTAAPQ